MQWRSRLFGTIALIVCLIELVGIWGTVAILVLTRQQQHLDWMTRPIAVLYVAGLASIPIAVIGLVKDTHRALAFAALILGFANILVCVLPFVSY
jgi:hypothetical protein